MPVYGRLRLGKGEWKRLLRSNRGLFRRAGAAPGFVIGPRLTKDGRVTGDMLVMETEAFEEIATAEQRRFYNELRNTNPSAAIEYVLTISGSIERWKEDIKWLKILLDYLKKEEKRLRREEEIAEIEEHLMRKIPPILQRHFSEIFKELESEYEQVEFMIRDIKKLESRIGSIEKYLEKYLIEKRSQMPFLFE